MERSDSDLLLVLLCDLLPPFLFIFACLSLFLAVLEPVFDFFPWDSVMHAEHPFGDGYEIETIDLLALLGSSGAVVGFALRALRAKVLGSG